MIISDSAEMEPETKIVTRKIVTTQQIAFCRSRFRDAGSAFATMITSNRFLNDGSRQDKSYGLGRVGFPQTEPAVAVQAVSI